MAPFCSDRLVWVGKWKGPSGVDQENLGAGGPSLYSLVAINLWSLSPCKGKPCGNAGFASFRLIFCFVCTLQHPGTNLHSHPHLIPLIYFTCHNFISWLKRLVWFDKSFQLNSVSPLFVIALRAGCDTAVLDIVRSLARFCSLAYWGKVNFHIE